MRIELPLSRAMHRLRTTPLLLVHHAPACKSPHRSLITVTPSYPLMSRTITLSAYNQPSASWSLSLVPMLDNLLTTADQQEALSRAYVTAVAARAGYVTSEMSPDRDGVDMRIHAGGPMRPALDLQLKATTNLRPSTNELYRFRLKRRNYDLLRIPTQTPRLLIVLDLPKDNRQWVNISADRLVLRKRAYWMDLRGHTETANVSSITVRIPADNVFDVETLSILMERSRSGRISS